MGIILKIVLFLMILLVAFLLMIRRDKLKLEKQYLNLRFQNNQLSFSLIQYMKLCEKYI